MQDRFLLINNGGENKKERLKSINKLKMENKVQATVIE